MRRVFFLGFSLVGCANGLVDDDAGTPIPRVDANVPMDARDGGPPTIDADRDEDAFLAQDDAFALADTNSTVDAERAMDAFTPPDAFAPRDAFSTPDVFRAPDTFVPPDAFAPDAFTAGCTPPPASGSLVLSGTTVGAPAARRAEAGFLEDCPSDLSTAAIPFRTHTICAASTAATYEVRVGGSIRDSFLVLYEGLSVPADRTECALLDDDSGGASQAMITVDVAAGTAFTALVTGYAASDVGAYTLTLRRL